MAKKKAAKPRTTATRKPAVRVGPELTEAERDLVSHMERGFQLEADSLGGNLVLRRLKDDDVMRPLSANRNTIKALEGRGLIAPGKSSDPLRILWRLKKS